MRMKQWKNTVEDKMDGYKEVGMLVSKMGYGVYELENTAEED